MKKFLIKVFVYSIPLIIITFCLEIYLRNYDSDYSQKLAGLNQKESEIEVLVLGNSHAFNGVDTRQFEMGTYNMAGLNQSIYYDKRITLKYLDQLENLKYVLIGVDYHSLYFSSQGIRDVWSYYSYDIKYKDQSYFKEKLSYFWFGYTPRITLSILKTKFLDRINDLEHNDGLIDGWEPLKGTEEGAFNKSNLGSRAEYFNSLVAKSSEMKDVKNDLESFISVLKNHNIIPIIYTSPITNDLYDQLNKEVIKKNANYIQEIIEKFDIRYWDLRNSIADKALFYNSDHLNVQGAKLYSEILNERMVELNSSPFMEM